MWSETPPALRGRQRRPDRGTQHPACPWLGGGAVGPAVRFFTLHRGPRHTAVAQLQGRLSALTPLRE
eukprot:11431180-Alexandrium_andersonii.AAC.1